MHILSELIKHDLEENNKNCLHFGSGSNDNMAEDSPDTTVPDSTETSQQAVTPVTSEKEEETLNKDNGEPVEDDKSESASSEDEGEIVDDDEKDKTQMDNNENDNEDNAASEKDNKNENEDNDMEAEVEAIAEANKAANEKYTPSQSLLQNSSPYPLIRSVDGISLKKYNPNPSRYSASDLIVPLRGQVDFPIHVTNSGSIVEYSVECKDYDIGFGIRAEREEGVTMVKKEIRQDAHLQAVTGRFLVGSVPCALIFSFDNDYSWFREKKVSYKIKVTPPSIKNIIEGRRTRANAALDVVLDDKKSAESRLEDVSTQHTTLVEEIALLQKQLDDKKKSRGTVEKEENWLKERVQLRDVQQSLLSRRLEEGWEDEVKDDKEDAEKVDRAEI